MVSQKASFDRGDIVAVSFDPSAGHEQAGSRPALVVSKAIYNAHFPPVVVAITTGGGHARMKGLAVDLDQTTKTTGIVRCDQFRVMDLDARGATLIEKAPEAVVNQVLAKLNAILS